MCGITGFIDFNKNTSKEILENMVDTLHHRGPDDRGTQLFQLNDCIVGLAQARLSIIDLSEGGHQPMHYENLSIVFNGEIYNYKQVKKTLIDLGHQFVSSSDTEVILHAFVEWGKDCVEKFIGMFAIVLLDKRNQQVHFCRDRAGVKPFYYYWKNHLLLFASELKAFHEHSLFEKEIDQAALEIYFDYGYIPSPYSIFKNCKKLRPGHWLSIDLESEKSQSQTYWNVHDFYKKEESKIGYEQAKEEIHTVLKSACEYRMVADVPVGVFLSGGYDSTAVTAILQKDRTERLKTFTIGFEEGNNEAPFAKETALFLGTEHNEYFCSTKEAQDIIPYLPFYYDEPFADSSAIPTTLVSIMARKQVTVALSADAGDEVFAGYNSYPKMLAYSEKLNRIPSALKPVASLFLKASKKFISTSKPELRHKFNGIAEALQSNEKQQLADLVWKATCLPNDFASNIFAKKIGEYQTGYQIDTNDYRDGLSVLLAMDYDMYLENDILAKVDRATMSVSLEGREPLLDHRLLELAATLPSQFKYDGTVGKKILKDIVHEYIPKEMMERPKTGFSLPIYSWLQNDLSYLLDEYLNKMAIDESQLFNSNFVLNIVQQFRRGNFHYKTLIWKLLMFQMWYKKWMNSC